MATQKEVLNYISKNLIAERVEDEIFRIVYDLGNDRNQVVFALVGEASLSIASPFANTEDVTPKQALKSVEEINFGIGTLAGWYVVRHVVPLDDLDESEIITGLEEVARIADELEDSLVGGDSF